jgi:hypothetical protein
MVAHTWSISIQEAEVGRSRVQSQPGLQGKNFKNDDNYNDNDDNKQKQPN